MVSQRLLGCIYERLQATTKQSETSLAEPFNQRSVRFMMFKSQKNQLQGRLSRLKVQELQRRLSWLNVQELQRRLSRLNVQELQRRLSRLHVQESRQNRLESYHFHSGAHEYPTITTP